MKERIVPMFLFALVSIVCLAAEPAKSADGNDSWKLATERNGFTIYSRPHSGSSLKEFKAVGEIAAPSRAVSMLIRASCLIWQSADCCGTKAIRS